MVQLESIKNIKISLCQNFVLYGIADCSIREYQSFKFNLWLKALTGYKALATIPPHLIHNCTHKCRAQYSDCLAHGNASLCSTNIDINKYNDNCTGKYSKQAQSGCLKSCELSFPTSISSMSLISIVWPSSLPAGRLM